MGLIQFIHLHYFLFILLLVLSGGIAGNFLNSLIFLYPEIIKHSLQLECMKYLKQPITIKPIKYNLRSPRSHCFDCQKNFRKLHKIPLVSYLLLQGRCFHCQAIISPIYFLVELLTPAIMIVTIAHFGLTQKSIFSILFSWSLMVLSFIDFREKVLPDKITLPLLWIGLSANVLSIFTSIHNAVLGAISGYLILWSLTKFFNLMHKKEMMGHGDFKLLAMIGAWLGASALPLILLISVISAWLISAPLIIPRKFRMMMRFLLALS